MPQHPGTTPKQPTSVVTGAAGFLASHLTDLLLARGHKVIGINKVSQLGAKGGVSRGVGQNHRVFSQEGVSREPGQGAFAESA